MFKNKTGGIFVEVGGYDGMYSHTLMYEVTRNWTGLLIERHPQLPLLKRAHRKVCYVADVCLSTEDHPGKGQLTAQDNHAGSSAMGPGPKFYPKTSSNFSVYDVQTVPLYAILAAVGIREVDLFILDIQALELRTARPQAIPLRSRSRSGLGGGGGSSNNSCQTEGRTTAFNGEERIFQGALLGSWQRLHLRPRILQTFRSSSTLNADSQPNMSLKCKVNIGCSAVR